MDSLSANRLLPLLVTLGALALAAYVGLRNFQDIQSIRQAGPAAAIPSDNQQTQDITAATDLNQMAKWHLFGRAAQKPETTATPVNTRTEAPKTRLKLTLQGIFSPSTAGGEGWAIIESPKEGQLAYRIGDEVPGGAILSAVETDQVILTRNNRPESLPLEVPEESGSDTSFSSLPGTTPRRPSQRQPQARISQPASNSPQGRPNPAAGGLIPQLPPLQKQPAQVPEAIKSANQELLEEMKRLRQNFPQQ